jgi:hypothetical protein
MNFDVIERRILSFPVKSIGAGVGEHEIEEASRRLKVPFCGGYRRFLQRFGWVSIADFDIFGLGDGIPRYLDLIVITESERTEMEPSLPQHLLPIMNNGGGDLVCLDTSVSSGEPPVVVWWHEDGPNQVPEPTAADFLSWLSAMLEDRGG